MKSWSTHSVVEQMANELAARRRATVGRRAAYLALARVILQSDERHERLVPPQETSSHDRKVAAAAA